MSPIRSFSVLARSLLITLIAACVSPPTSSPQSQPPGDVEGDQSLADWHPQGSELLALPPGLELLSIALTGWVIGSEPPTTVAVVDGQLTVDGRPTTDFTGATFTAIAPGIPPVPMRITSVIPHNPWNATKSTVRYDYVVELQGRDRAWRGLCPGEYPGATLIPGSFGIGPVRTGSKQVSNGDYWPTAGEFTFSCRDGVAAKCIDWGYEPWSQGGDMAPYFQACTRMARADYCGNGHSRTVEGTMISFGDTHAPPVTRFALPPGFEHEAVWGRGRGTKGQPAAICLSRTRWSTIPIGDRSPCADLMPDLRVEPGASPQYCEDLTAADWTQAGALFFSTSRMIDVGLFQWTDGAGHYATTARFPWYGNDVAAPGPPGYPQFVSIEGSVYKPTPQPPPVSGLVPLFHYTKFVGTISLALTTTDPSPGGGFGDRVLEAYVFGPSTAPPVPTAQPLVLYGDDLGNFATTTDPRPPVGYTKIAVLGWVPH